MGFYALAWAFSVQPAAAARRLAAEARNS
jgi:hypothetical protein